MIKSGNKEPSKSTSWKVLETVMSHLKAESETLARRLSAAVSRAISEALGNQSISVRIMISLSVFSSARVYFLSTVMDEFEV